VPVTKLTLTDKAEMAELMWGQGWSEAETAAQYNCSQQRAGQIREQYREEFAQRHQDLVDALFMRNLWRLERVIDAHTPKSDRGDNGSSRTIIKALEREAKMLGHDSPTDVNVRGRFAGGEDTQLRWEIVAPDEITKAIE
jgi:hypothetical protein